MESFRKDFHAHESFLTARDTVVKLYLFVLQPLQIVSGQDVLPYLSFNLHGKSFRIHYRVYKVKFIKKLVAILL